MCHCTTHRRAVASSKMMVIGPMLPSDLQCIPSSKMILLPYLPVNNVKSGCYFHRQQTNTGMGRFDFELSHRTNITNLNNKYRLFSRRKVLDQFYSPMRKTGKLLSKLYASQPLKMKLDENQSSQEYSKENAEDYVSRLLRERPSQVEPKFLIGDELYTLREREQLKTSFGKRINEALNVIISKLASKDTQETGRREEKQYGIYGGETDKDGQPKPVFLKELLRQYKGELYVPEEVFKFHASEVDEFNRNLETLPEMLLEDFLRAMRANQIEMLTSRAVQTPQGNYLYRDFVIDLKDIPGDRSLQRKKWAMHLSEAEAQAVLGEYSGPQREIERLLTPYVVPPPVMPHPVASSISSRVMLELAMVTSVVTAAAFAVGGLLSAMVFTVTSLVTIIAIRVIWPLTLPLLKSLALLFVNFGKVIWKILTGAGRKGGLFGYLSDVYNYFASGGLYSTLQTGGPVLFVLITMVVLIKFTLTRRPKDFRKWDIWQAIEFGQSKPQARVEGSTGVTFSDVAGIDEVVGELQELVKYLKNPELFNKMGTKPPHGVLLEGPPGCGKTLVAKAIAGEAGVPFYQMAGSEFVEVLVGVGAARVRDLFKRAKVNKPSVVFIDEIDALGAMRHGISGQSNMENYDAGAQERETTLNQLLIELDGFDTGQGVIFLGATNRMDLLDPALLRPGRFDRKIAVRPPAEKGRLDILKVHAKKVKLSPSVDLSVYAKNLPGWSGAELAQLLQEAALMAVRHGHDSIIQSDMDQAVDRLTMGPERIGVESHSPTLWRRATGEVGTALVSHLLRRLENAQVESCDRISIIPRGETLSRTIFNRLDDEAYLFERRPQLLHRMQVMLGGRAAEEVMYGHNTSMVSLSYLPDASWLACKIISVWNLENPMTIHGEPASWKHSPSFTGPPLHFEGSLYEDYGLHEKSLNYNLDNDVALRTEKLVHDMYKHTLTLIQRYHAALAKSIYVVMEKREIKGDDLDLIIDRYPADTPVHLVEEEENPGSLPKGVEFQQVLPSEASDSSNVSWEKTAQEEQLRSKTMI